MKPLICVPMGDPAGLAGNLAAAWQTLWLNAARVVNGGQQGGYAKGPQPFAKVNLPVNLLQENLSGIKEGCGQPAGYEQPGHGHLYLWPGAGYSAVMLHLSISKSVDLCHERCSGRTCHHPH